MGWGNGSNFRRDMTQKMKDGLIDQDKKDSTKFVITQKGIRYVKNLTSEKRSIIILPLNNSKMYLLRESTRNDKHSKGRIETHSKWLWS